MNPFERDKIEAAEQHLKAALATLQQGQDKITKAELGNAIISLDTALRHLGESKRQ